MEIKDYADFKKETENKLNEILTDFQLKTGCYVEVEMEVHGVNCVKRSFLRLIVQLP